MPYKDDEKRKEMQRKYSSEHYQRNRLKVIENIQQYKRKRREEFMEFKSQLSCQMCGLTGIPDAIDFHHTDPKAGDAKIFMLMKNHAYAKLLKEVAKCVPLCATCHRIVHAEERLLKSQQSSASVPAVARKKRIFEGPSGDEE